jgi:excisionase family DNA binding protein
MEPTPQALTLTVEQAAKVLGIGRSTAYELVHTGAIPSLRLGRRIVVPTARLADQLGVEPSGIAAIGPATATAEDLPLADEGCPSANGRSGTLF